MKLFMNGVECMEVKNGKYYIVNEETGWDYMKQCTRNEFIQELKNMSWVCLTTWDKELTKQYLDLVNYVKEME